MTVIQMNRANEALPSFMPLAWKKRIRDTTLWGTLQQMSCDILPSKGNHCME